ncbi:NADPH:quinone reductase [Celeribacter baekdonensis]|uniref:enoyl-[acyl-carrier-protein] reductase n=1 Tax=Celeribacter baekdonensis TaxID=875171 RepID=A0A1G7PF89_9RHOB|nr:2-enoyl thioester reductase domain-containing protein [Celeribacter baekdonensis]SDF85002.1 NADPH:quinone reductase [Celeribacter baekdonensis]
MKQVQFEKTGRPAEVAFWADVPEPILSADDQVLVRIEAFPINPSDLLLFRGVYPRTPVNGDALGNEATGIVEAVGAGVGGVKPGDRVISLRTDNWRERQVLRESELIRLAPGLGTETAAVLKVNPATAFLMLKDFTALSQGDWIIQNAANSAVGRSVIEIAKRRGLRTLNVLRRGGAADDLRALGAEHVIADNDSLPGRVAELIGEGDIKLGLDAIGGSSTGRLAQVIGPSGTLVIYGGMSGQPSRFDAGQFVFRDLRLRGFWLTKFLSEAPRESIVSLYDSLVTLALDGAFRPEISGRFHISRLREALGHAEATMGRGKTLVTFD